MRAAIRGRSLLRDERGATMVEFALIAVLFFVIVFGICELALMLFQWKSAEKAVQLGVRLAIVSEPLSGVPALNPKASSTVSKGQPCGGIGNGTCAEPPPLTITPCPQPCPVGSTPDYIITRMQEVFPQLLASEVTISYEYVGLGFAGGPYTPAVTVAVSRPFNFIIVDDLLALLAGGPVLAPMVMNVKSSTLTSEDHSF
jgi:hypothetical protein